MEIALIFNCIKISIVGAGSAGAVVSSRLSENGSYSVLLIEAGGYPSPLVNIPLISGILPSTPFSWNYQTEPQKLGHEASIGHVTNCLYHIHVVTNNNQLHKFLHRMDSVAYSSDQIGQEEKALVDQVFLISCCTCAGTSTTMTIGLP